MHQDILPGIFFSVNPFWEITSQKVCFDQNLNFHKKIMVLFHVTLCKKVYKLINYSQRTKILIKNPHLGFGGNECFTNEAFIIKPYTSQRAQLVLDEQFFVLKNGNRREMYILKAAQIYFTSPFVLSMHICETFSPLFL